MFINKFGIDFEIDNFIQNQFKNSK